MQSRRNGGNDPDLQLVPASGRTRWWLFLLAVAIPLLLALVLAAIADDRHAGAIARLPGAQWLPEYWLLPLWAEAIAVPIWLAINWSLSRQRLRVGAGGIEVVSSWFRNRVALPELQLDAARVIDLDEHPEYRPFLKMGGIGLPGFHAGWFRTRRFKRLFVATAGGRRVLWLPTTKKHAMLLEVRKPQRLLVRLRELAGGG